MKKFRIHGWAYGNVSTVVEAESKEEAKEIAMNDRLIATPCNQCSGGGDENEEWTLPYEYDSVQEIIEISEID